MLGAVMIGELVSSIKLSLAESAVIFRLLSALEPLMPAKIRHPLVPLSTLAAHVMQQGLFGWGAHRLSLVRGQYVWQFDLGELHGL